MKKHLIAALPFALLLGGCAANVDSAPTDDEDTGEAREASVTSFFNTDDGASTFCVDGAPIVKHPSVNNNNAVFVDAAASCIMQGATMTLLVPFSVATYGPFAMGWDQSGTRLKANVGLAFPVGSCRIVQVTNPNGKPSNLASLCR